MPAPKNNQNATKPPEDKATSFLYLRCTPGNKASWTKAAGKLGLSKWAITILNREAAIDEVFCKTYEPSKPLDVIMTSPECVMHGPARHSKARGGKPDKDQVKPGTMDRIAKAVKKYFP